MYWATQNTYWIIDLPVAKGVHRTTPFGMAKHDSLNWNKLNYALCHSYAITGANK